MSSVIPRVHRGFRGLRALLGVALWRRLFLLSGLAFLLLYLWTIQDVSMGGRGFELQTAAWDRMLQRMGPLTFEPIARISVPGLTLLVSPLDLLVGAIPGALVGLGVTLTAVALRRPDLCGASPALIGAATLLFALTVLAPGATVVLQIPVPASFVPLFQLLIPAALLLLLSALAIGLARTDPERGPPATPTPPR